MTKKLLWTYVLILFPLSGVSHPSHKGYCLGFNDIIYRNIHKIGIPAASFSTILPNKKQISCA